MDLAGLGDGKDFTCSLLEFHRLNSPYIMSGTTKEGVSFADIMKPQLGLAMSPAGKKGKGKGKVDDPADEPAGDKERDDVAGVVNLRKLAAVCFKYDPNSLSTECSWRRSPGGCGIREHCPHSSRQAASAGPTAVE